METNYRSPGIMVFVDTGWDKPHVCYDPVEDRFFEVKLLAELKDYDEIFLDSLFPEIYHEVLELMRGGVDVFVLKQPRLIKEVRARKRLKKTDANDAMILSLISLEEFRKLKEEDVLRMKLQPIFNKYIAIVKICQKITNLQRLCKSIGIVTNLKDLLIRRRRFVDNIPADILGILEEIDVFDLLKTELAAERWRLSEAIHKQMGSYWLYEEGVKAFGLKKSVELALLSVYVDFSKGLRKIAKYTHLIEGDYNNYSRVVNDALSKFANSLYRNSYISSRVANALRRYVDIRKLQSLPRRKALFKLKVLTIKTLRRIYRDRQAEGLDKSG